MPITGVGGPVSVSDLPSRHALGEAFHGASERLGAPRNPDFNGATQLGTGYVQTTTRKGADGRRPPDISGELRSRTQCRVARAGREDRARGKAGRRHSLAGQLRPLGSAGPRRVAEHSIRRSCSSFPVSGRRAS
jgi:choline dehydrogenase-like flavoprotein